MRHEQTGDARTLRRSRPTTWSGYLARAGVLAALLAVGCAGQDRAPVAQQIAPASDPSHVSFTLEGCRNDGSITFPEFGPFICPDAAYTTGNLGKGWNELDLVPHRVTTATGKAAPATQTYTIAVAVDMEDAGHPGYDALSEPVLNTGLSDGSCAPPVVGPATPLSPGIGGTDTTLYRLVTFTQLEQTECVYDWYARLALGSHLYPGSSLHANLLNQSLTTSGIGSKEVSIPVKEILPQELSKDMIAEQDANHIWNITKGATPATITFPNTCSEDSADREKPVSLTIAWEKLPASPWGEITAVTNIYAKNPAHRTITVEACDDIRAGETSIDAMCFPDLDVPANSGSVLVATHTAGASESDTDLNDIATASYIDKVTGIPVPGQTTATASAEVQPSGTELNQTATISDAEMISGAGLTFSADSVDPAGGSFGSYVLGTPTSPGPVTWSSDSQSGGATVEFDKTVYVDVATITSGTLSDTATLTGSDGFTATASASVGISAAAKVSLTINKCIPDILSGAETETFCFEVKDSGAAVKASKTISFAAGETFNWVTVDDLEPDIYTVTELPKSLCSAMQSDKWDSNDPQVVDITLDRGCMGLACCSGSVSFANYLPSASARARKVTIPAGSEGGWELTLKKGGIAIETVTTSDAGYVAFTAELDEGSYTIEETLKPYYEQVSQSAECSFTVDYPDDAGRLYSCTFTNRFIPEGKVTPTNTTCQDFIAGTAADLTEVGYGPKDGLINNAAPGVFFYYTKVTAPGGTCFTVDVKQQVTPPAYSPAYLFEIQQAPATSQVKLYDGACGTSGLGTVSFPGRGQTQVVVCGAAPGAGLIISVKYEGNSIVGLADPSPASLHYDFSTDLNGAPVDFDIDGVDLIAK